MYSSSLSWCWRSRRSLEPLSQMTRLDSEGLNNSTVITLTFTAMGLCLITPLSSPWKKKWRHIYCSYLIWNVNNEMIVYSRSQARLETFQLWWCTWRGHAGSKHVKQLLSVGLCNRSRLYQESSQLSVISLPRHSIYTFYSSCSTTYFSKCEHCASIYGHLFILLYTAWE